MEDRIEAAQDRVQECSKLIRELLDEYGCYIYTRDFTRHTVVSLDDLYEEEL